jgi:hypothetical protein
MTGAAYGNDLVYEGEGKPEGAGGEAHHPPVGLVVLFALSAVQFFDAAAAGFVEFPVAVFGFIAMRLSSWRLFILSVWTSNWSTRR